MDDLRDQPPVWTFTEQVRPIVCFGLAHALLQPVVGSRSKIEPELRSTELGQVMLAERYPCAGLMI